MRRITLFLLLCTALLNVPRLDAQRLTENPLERWHALNAQIPKPQDESTA